MHTKFSFIVPVYKVEAYIKKCVESILNQTYTNFEVILVDDGSPDSCPQICDEYEKKDSRVKVIHKQNGGLVSARNAGVAEATGEYVCYVDGDDWISENYLAHIMDKAIEKHNPDLVIFGIQKVFRDNAQIIPQRLKEGYYDKARLNAEIYPYLMYDCRESFCNGIIFPAACNKVYRTTLLKDHLCKDERIRMGEDNAFVFEFTYYAKSMFYMNEVLYFYNQMNSGSITSTYDANRFQNNKLLTEYMCSNLAGKDSVMDNQLNAFKAYWLIMAVFHEIKSGRKISIAAKHIKTELKTTEVLKGIRMKGLPITAKGFLMLLHMHFYHLALLGAKIIEGRR